AAGATNYRLYPSTGGPPINLGATTSYTQTQLSTNAAYGLAVAGATNGGEGPLTPGATAFTLAARPAALASVFVGVSSVSLTWSANTNAGGIPYWVEVSTSNNFAVDAATLTVTTTSA